jgi:ribonuclease P protein component
MIPRSFRLPARTQLRNAHFLRTSFCTIKIAKNDVGYSRFGVIIAKRVAKTAVDRNRSKRLIRTYIEQERERIPSGYDILVLIQKNLAKEHTIDIAKACAPLQSEL